MVRPGHRSEDSIFGQTGARVGACPTVGATQYIGKLIGERRAKEMIFLCKRYSGEEAPDRACQRVGSCADLLGRVEEVVAEIKGYSSADDPGHEGEPQLRLRLAVPSWQHGMELLANIWGTEESLEGMNAFLEKRPADFHSSANATRPKLDSYMDDFNEGHNQSEHHAAPQS